MINGAIETVCFMGVLFGGSCIIVMVLFLTAKFIVKNVWESEEE